MKVSADKEMWSESSKKSLSYELANDFYENIPYRCYKCGEGDVFTAAEQKERFEVKKAYIWERRYLCNSCYIGFKSLKKEIADYEEKWKEESESSKATATYLRGWLSCLNKVPSYGKQKNESMVAHLFKLINHT